MPLLEGLHEMSHGPAVQRMWGGRDVRSLLTLDEFADALSGVCVFERVYACACVCAYACAGVQGMRTHIRSRGV